MNLLKWIFIFTSSYSFSQVKQQSWTQNCVVGDSTRFDVFENGDRYNYGVMFINVHEDETTSIDALKVYAKDHEIRFFYLLHEKKNRVTFTINEKEYSVDPSMIFTKKGRKKTLKEGGSYSRKALKEVFYFSFPIANRIAGNRVIVAMNNNTNENYSINSYLPNGAEEEKTKQIYVNNEMDADDFIYTNDSSFFEAFKTREINVVLQDNEVLVDDGSLPFLCKITKRRYINIETQTGHFDAQLKLIDVVMDITNEELKLNGHLIGL